MASSTHTITLRLDERLRESKRQATSMSLPFAVHHRLDLIAGLAADVNASRAEIIGMFIAEAELDAQKLEERVLAYRKMLVADVVPHAPQEASERSGGNVVELPVRPVGRPKRAAG